MALSQLAINKGKAKDKPYMLSDGGGLHLQIDISGSKFWRVRFRFGGKANMMSLGPYPAVSLKDAREKRDEIKKQLAAGINPSLRKKLARISAILAHSSSHSMDTMAGQFCNQHFNFSSSPCPDPVTFGTSKETRLILQNGCGAFRRSA